MLKRVKDSETFKNNSNKSLYILCFILFLFVSLSCENLNDSVYDDFSDKGRNLDYVGDNGSPSRVFPLGLCQGDCDNNDQCEDGLVCFERSGTEPVPGCSGSGRSGKDYCIRGLHTVGNNGRPSTVFPLGLCQGDCDSDRECAPGLVCRKRDGNEPVPGCYGKGRSGDDYCYNPGNNNNDDDDDDDDDDNNGNGRITHIGTNEVWDGDGQNIRINRPSGSRSGDLLILVLHRTDDDLPLHVNGWTRVAECFKKDNGYDCSTENDCTSWHNNSFCGSFGGHGGHDLAQSIFFKRVSSNEPNSYNFNLNRDSTGEPGWIILTALRGANTSNPVRDWAYKGCDKTSDSLFPSVYAKAGDMILLSQSFDDAVAQSKFRAPNNKATFGYVSNSDEAGFLFGGTVSSSGETGSMRTNGDGASSCKDALISLSIKPQP